MLILETESVEPCRMNLCSS